MSNMKKQNIRVLLADDHKIVRTGLRSILEREADITVIAEADNGRQALQCARELDPHVVLMDLSMPEMSGIEATRRLVEETRESRVLALSMHSDRRFIMEALHAGASGYLLKDCAAEELVGAIRMVSVGKSYLSPKIAGVVMNDAARPYSPKAHPSPHALLSGREREVLQLIAEGNNTKEVAYLLEISVKTVETHRAQLMRKLKLSNVVELTRYAIREGLATLE